MLVVEQAEEEAVAGKELLPPGKGVVIPLSRKAARSYAPSVGNRGCPRLGFRGSSGNGEFFRGGRLGKLRGFPGANPVCDGGGSW